MHVIEINHLNKSYGKTKALKDLSIKIPKGSILGLLGPNGAGKTTLVSILTGIIPKDQGTVYIDGLDLDNDLGQIQAKCSIVPQTLAFYPILTAFENLEYFGSLNGLYGKELKSRIKFSVEVAGLQKFLKKRATTYSGGMNRRLNLAIGLLNNPEILYFDEPTVGVDTQSRNYMLEMIKNINKEHKTTIIYTSHYIEEIENVSDNIAIIDEGKLILYDTKENILKESSNLSIETEFLNTNIKHKLELIDGVKIDNNNLLVKEHGNFNKKVSHIFSLLDAENIEIKHIKSDSNKIEELFLELTNKRLRD